MTDPAKVSGSTLWLGILLVASLAVNTFFVGLAVGGRLSDHRLPGLPDGGPGFDGSPHAEFSGPMPPDLDPRMLARMLPESARPGARALIEERGSDIRDLFIASIEARGAALEAMRAEPFDADGLQGALDTSLAADMAARSAVHDLTVDIVAGMTDEERAQIGANLHERFPHDHDWRERRERRDRWRDGDRHYERHYDRHRDEPPPPDEEDPEDRAEEE